MLFKVLMEILLVILAVILIIEGVTFLTGIDVTVYCILSFAMVIFFTLGVGASRYLVDD